MTLYGLDLVQDQQGKYHLLEINGICSGMKGFEHIYGDDRVEDQVYQMLEQRYGKLSVNDGVYQVMKFKKEHPFKFVWNNVKDKIPFLRKRDRSLQKLFSLPTARMDWLLEKIPHPTGRLFPFESYIGQDSAVLSTHYNQELPHPLVNPYLTEAIAYNKFFTYQVLKDSSISGMVPRSTLLGLGFTHEDELAELLDDHSSFVIKPILGSQGRGIEFILKEAAKKHQHSRGPVDVPGPISSLYAKPEHLVYVEDLVKLNAFSFQPGLGIIQPFIDSRRSIDGAKKYTSIRAIVCNERFVDAYTRVSLKKKVNLSQRAQAYPCREKNEIASLSEKIVTVFEEECLRYEPANFKQELYGQYTQSRGETTLEMRERDAQKGLEVLMFDLTTSKLGRLP